MDIQIFDNFEEDGQLTLFGLEEDYEELRTYAKKTEPHDGKKASGKQAVKESAAGKQTAEESPSGEQVTAEPALGVQMSAEQPVGQQSSDHDSIGIRIRRCSSCGKLLFVKEEDGSYSSACNACGIQYLQK